MVFHGCGYSQHENKFGIPLGLDTRKVSVSPSHGLVLVAVLPGLAVSPHRGPLRFPFCRVVHSFHVSPHLLREQDKGFFL